MYAKVVVETRYHPMKPKYGNEQYFDIFENQNTMKVLKKKLPLDS